MTEEPLPHDVQLRGPTLQDLPLQLFGPRYVEAFLEEGLPPVLESFNSETKLERPRYQLPAITMMPIWMERPIPSEEEDGGAQEWGCGQTAGLRRNAAADRDEGQSNEAFLRRYAQK